MDFSIQSNSFTFIKPFFRLKDEHYASYPKYLSNKNNKFIIFRLVNLAYESWDENIYVLGFANLKFISPSDNSSITKGPMEMTCEHLKL